MRIRRRKVHHKAFRRKIVWTAVRAGAVAAALWLGAGHAAAQKAAPKDAASIVGAWTLNKELSDLPPSERAEGGAGRRSQGGRGGGGGFGRGGGRGGGFPGGGGGGYPGSGSGGGSGGGSGRDPEEIARRIDALREFTDAPAHLTIVQTESMIIVTTDQGRTIRLSPDGAKVKDESTHVERRTKWEGDRLVTEITGSLGNIKEIYSLDAAHHELMVIVRLEQSGREDEARVFHRIYSADSR